MKMSKESYTKILEKFKKHEQDIKNYAEKLKDAGGYNNFNVRLTWDCLNQLIGTRVICDIYYDVEKLHDVHITTAGQKALKEIGIF